MDERYLYLDILAGEGSKETQAAILEFVMKTPNVTEGELSRCLFHAIAIKNPIWVRPPIILSQLIKAIRRPLV